VHVRYVCIALFIIASTHALHSIWGTIYSILIFFSSFLEKLLQIFFFLGWQIKHVGQLFFCLCISKPLPLRTGLIFPHMLGLYIVSFPYSMSLLFFCLFFSQHKKKKWGRRCRILFFILIAFQLLYVFLPDISIHCALIDYAYIWLRVYAWHLLSFPVHLNARELLFSSNEKLCTIQSSLRYIFFFYLIFSFWKF